MFEGWRVIDTGTRLLVVRGCGSAATKIHLEELIRAAQEAESTQPEVVPAG